MRVPWKPLTVVTAVAATVVVVLGFTGILDSVTAQPLGAYSVALRLRKAYTGNLFRVVRDSDSAELNIGYESDGDWDNAALSTHCTGTNCLVMTVYDQSGNGRDLTSAAAGNRPKVWDSSTGAVTCGTAAKLCMQFDPGDGSAGAVDWLRRTDSLGLTGSPELHLFWNYQRTGSSTLDKFHWTIGTSASGTHVGVMVSGSGTRTAVSYLNGVNQFNPNEDAWQFYGMYKALNAAVGDTTMESGGSAMAETGDLNPSNTTNIANTSFSWGATSGGTFTAEGKSSTLIVWNAQLTGTDLTNIRTGMATLN